MHEFETIDRAVIADGTEFVLALEEDEWTVRVKGRVLMSSRVHDSEISLAEQAIDRAADAQTVLVGGLGMGFTLRAVLDRVADDARVTVAELVPELVEWNRTHLAALNDRACDDPRCEIVVGDVHAVLKRATRTFDVILLDVDNGPVALSQAANQRLYSDHGVRMCSTALRPGGVLAVWSAGPNARFERRLNAAGFDVEVLRVAAQAGAKPTHILFVGQKARRAGGRASKQEARVVGRDVNLADGG